MEEHILSAAMRAANTCRKLRRISIQNMMNLRNTLEDIGLEVKKSDSFPKLDQEMKNILLAINLSDDYYKAQDVVVNLQKDNEDLEKEIFHMKHDMIDLKSRLEKQEKKNKSLKEEKRELERKLIQLETKAQSSSKENAEDSQDDSQTDPKETEEKTSTGNALNSSISKSNTVGYKK